TVPAAGRGPGPLPHVPASTAPAPVRHPAGRSPRPPAAVSPCRTPRAATAPHRQKLPSAELAPALPRHSMLVHVVGERPCGRPSPQGGIDGLGSGTGNLEDVMRYRRLGRSGLRVS